jgi:hypothetical protein
MKTIHAALLSIVLLLGLAVSGLALAHGRVGVFIGAPIFWPGYYPAPYYSAPYYAPSYYPPAVVESSGPTTYIERGGYEAAPAQSPENWYYYCAAAKGYYPYVKQCAGGWQRIAPQPPAAR